MTVAIRVEGLGKQYFLGGVSPSNRTAREALSAAALGALRSTSVLLKKSRGARAESAFWALQDVSFEVPEGDAFGVIGGNGAGKSTLLKLLTRITAPTRGRAAIRGRIGSLLEVGTGFHPDLTGRENVFLNGAILGMRHREVARKFEEIVSFAEVEKFIDTPVKRYSSGMYLRLAFAVAAHLESEVLLIDEVLAVGDAAFQAKCLGKMGEVTAKGRTVLFVSHNLDAVQRLCSRSLLLERGRLKAIGPSVEVVSGYLSQRLQQPGPGAWLDVSKRERRGSGEARFVSVRYLGEPNVLAGQPHTFGPLEFSLEVCADEARTVPSLAVVLRDLGGTNLVNADIALEGLTIRLKPGRNVVRLRLNALYLNPGEYSADLWLGGGPGTCFDHLESVFRMRVLDPRPAGTGATPIVTGAVPCRLTARVDTAVLSPGNSDQHHWPAVEPCNEPR